MCRSQPSGPKIFSVGGRSPGKAQTRLRVLTAFHSPKQGRKRAQPFISLHNTNMCSAEPKLSGKPLPGLLFRPLRWPADQKKKRHASLQMALAHTSPVPGDPWMGTGRRGRKIFTHWQNAPPVFLWSKAWEEEAWRAWSPSAISASPPLSRITNGDPLTRSRNLQAPLAYAGDRVMARMSYFPHLLYATRFRKDKNN